MSLSGISIRWHFPVLYRRSMLQLPLPPLPRLLLSSSSSSSSSSVQLLLVYGVWCLVCDVQRVVCGVCRAVGRGWWLSSGPSFLLKCFPSLSSSAAVLPRSWSFQSWQTLQPQAFGASDSVSSFGRKRYGVCLPRESLCM